MSLKQSPNSIEALYRKLERESYRAYHERDRIHKTDHFYNFCITAQALRDYFFERNGLTNQRQQQPYNDIWKKNELLVVISEIANTAKHFTLRDRRTGNPKQSKTKKVRTNKSKYVDIYMNDKGDIFTKEVEAPDCVVTVENGSTYPLYMFTKEVLSYWYDFLKSQSINIRRQSLKRLIGERT